MMLSVGAEWKRWDPHIHAPLTLFNDQFNGDWHGYLSLLEEATPTIRALGVTDYYLLDSYRQVRKAKSEGRLPDCSLIFPNVELRLSISSSRAPLNVHLLVDSTDEDHEQQTERFLGRLTFQPYGEPLSCRPDDLARLGQHFKPQLKGREAIEEGAHQFKVNFEQLRSKWESSDWARNNILIAVAGGVRPWDWTD